MTPNTSAANLEDVVTRVERIATTIEQGGREVDLHDLRMALIEVQSLVARDPGIEAASQDLYDTAAACTSEMGTDKPPLRQQRLLRDARLRYRERLTRVGRAEHASSPGPVQGAEHANQDTLWASMETAPKDGTQILCFSRSREYEISHWDRTVQRWVSKRGFLVEASHWKALPAAPDEGPDPRVLRPSR
jgi:hypothetical protein